MEKKGKKIRILFLTINLENGGAERVLVNLANELVKRQEYIIEIRCLKKTGPHIERLSTKVKCTEIISSKLLNRGLNYLYLLPHKWIYRKIIGPDEYDIIIPYLHGVLTRIVAYAPRSQNTVAFLHANMENSPFIKQIGSKSKVIRVFENYNRIVAVSQDVKESFIKVSGIQPNRISVIYNTFDVNEIRRLSAEPLVYTPNKGIINLCSVGKLESVKGYERLIRVFELIKEKGIKSHLYIVGEGNQHALLQNMIDSKNLVNDVTLVGYKKNPYNYMWNCDLFVCSSYSEGFSSVVAESIILGKPVVTTDCAGMKEILGANNEYGVICPNNEEGLFNGLYHMISDIEILDYYRKKAIERSSFFEPETTVNSFLSLLDEVVDR